MAAASAAMRLCLVQRSLIVRHSRKPFKNAVRKTAYVFSKDGNTIESADRKIKNPALHFKPEFKYQMITFECKHLSEYANKGRGIRKHQIVYELFIEQFNKNSGKAVERSTPKCVT